MSRRMTQASRKLLTWIPMGAVAAATACAPQSREAVAPQPDRAVAPAAVAGAAPYTSGNGDPSRGEEASGGTAGQTRFINARERIQLASYQLGERAQQAGGEVQDSAQRARARELMLAKLQAEEQAREAARARQASQQRRAAQQRRRAAQSRRRAAQQARQQARSNKVGKGGQLLASSDAGEQAQPVKLACGLGNSKRPNYGDCDNSGVKK